MPRFRVDWSASGFYHVEAESKDEALDYAHDETWQYMEQSDNMNIVVEED